MSDHCAEALANLYTYLDQEMDDVPAADRIRSHLIECPPCDGAFVFEHRLKVVVRDLLHEEIPPRLIERLTVMIRSAPNA